MKRLSILLLVVLQVISLGLSACSDSSSENNSEIIFEAVPQSLSELGEFPVGMPEYTPAQITITSPTGSDPLPISSLSVIEAGKTWKLTVQGTFTNPTLSGQVLEPKAVYVNWEQDGVQLQSNSDGSTSFTAGLSVTRTDIDNIYFPIVVAVVDDSGYVAGARTVVALQEGSANIIGDGLAKAFYVKGDADFMKNIFNFALSSLNGQNLAYYLSSKSTLDSWFTTILDGSVDSNDSQEVALAQYLSQSLGLTPRCFMMQGAQVDNITPGVSAEGYPELRADVTVKNIVVEFSFPASSYYPKGRNHINFRIQDLQILNGFTICFVPKTVNGSTTYTAKLYMNDLATVISDGSKVAGGIVDLDCEPISVINGLLSQLADWFQQVLNLNTEIITNCDLFNSIVLNQLMSQITSQVSGEAALQALNLVQVDEDDNSIMFSGTVTLGQQSEEEQAIVSTSYATPDNDLAQGSELALTLGSGNSTVAFSDDYINQILATYLITDPADPTTITISKDDINTLIDQLKESVGVSSDTDVEIWNWLKVQNGGSLPDLSVEISINTPPVFEIVTGQDYFGIFHLNNMRLDVHEYETSAGGQLLASIAVDFDMKASWSNGKIVLSDSSVDADYILLFNKLYPLFLPTQITELPTVLAGTLNSILEKLGLIGYTTTNISAVDGYLVFDGELSTTRDLSRMTAHGFGAADWEKQYMASVLVGDEEYSYNASLFKVSPNSTKCSDSFENRGGISFQGLYFYAEPGADMTWDDSMGYTYTAGDTEVITHIEFTPRIRYYNYGLDLEFYEEFAVLSVLHESLYASESEEYTGSTTDSLASFVPRSSIAVAAEVNYGDYENNYSTGVDIPYTSKAGLGMRLNRAPYGSISMETVVDDITVYTVDLSVDNIFE